MKRIVVFSGTSEGRKLAEILSKASVPAAVCVATEYGEETMEPLPGITLHCGRMNLSEMKAFLEKEEFLAVVDATHPFATGVSENIRRCTGMLSFPEDAYMRLQRDTGYRGGDIGNAAQYFDTNEECAGRLLHTEGNILLTTGSKELEIYCKTPKLRERIYARVLPNEESIALCRKAGLKGKQIIAMQGPFSQEMNRAVLRQYHIRHMVTKESGKAGGFEEKAGAAKEAGVCLSVIGNPEKRRGLSFEEVLETLERLTGAALREKGTLHISLVGIGMGNLRTLSLEAREKIMEADCLFGAERMLESARQWDIIKPEAEICPFYRTDETLGKLEEIYRNRTERGRSARAAVLFSGDSGFYSGSGKLYEALQDWKETHPETQIRIYPGISSVAYFAALCGISWQDAKIISIHGKSGWDAGVFDAVRYHNKVFLLVSGVEDVRNVGNLLQENGFSDCRILTGFQLSYPEEKLAEYTPKQCKEIKEEGLYALFILNENHEKRYLAPKRSDGEFIRGKVPMTKEEIRELAVCKLRLTEDAVVYDIGSGTGSVAAEIAGRSGHIRVFAVERKEDGLELICKNCKKLRLLNVEAVAGEAPDALCQLPPPTHAFIGGSGGRLKEILETLYQKNPAMRIVVTAVSLETLRGITEALDSMQVKNGEMIQVQVSRAKRAGEYHFMQAENPVFICCFDFA